MRQLQAPSPKLQAWYDRSLVTGHWSLYPLLLYATLAVALFFGPLSALGHDSPPARGGVARSAGVVGAESRITNHGVQSAFIGVHRRLIPAAPRAQSAAECAVYGDMALTARALAVEGFPEDVRARVLGRIYHFLISQLEPDDTRRYVEVMALINRSADTRGGVDPAQFAVTINAHCQRSQGDLDGVFGVDS